MFGRKKNTAQPEQIPYSLYETLQQDSGRNRRWIFEVLLAAIIVGILVLSGVLLYKTIHNAKTPAPTQTQSQGTNTATSDAVTQSPQKNTDATSSTGQPATTDAGKSTNTQNVSQPTQ